jgi:bacterial/archaeal transporter family-2 protein
VSRALAVVLAVTAGCLVGMQAPVNARLSSSVGKLQAATFSFLVGTCALVLITAVVTQGGFGNLRHAGAAPWWALIGGLFGAVYVAVALATVTTLGASGLTAAVITGQLVVSAVIDRLGLFGITRQQLTPTRIVGLLLLVLGVFLVLVRR